MIRALLLLFLANQARAMSTTGDMLVHDELVVGTTTISALVTVQVATSTAIPLQISGVDDSPILQIGRQSRLGIDGEPEARIDVFGVADSSDTGLQLRQGNRYPDSAGTQVTFGYAGRSDLRHALKTLHSTATTSNEVQFYLWTPAVSSTAVGALQVLSLQTTADGVAVQVDPVAEIANADLEISNGASIGEGTMLSASESAPSSRALKKDVLPLGEGEERAALGDVAALKPKRFRYLRRTKKGLVRDAKQPLRTGLVYEEVPESVRGPGESVVLDERLVNLELGLKELIRRLEKLQAEAPR